MPPDFYRSSVSTRRRPWPPATVVAYAAEVAVVLATLLATSGLNRELLLGAPVLILATVGLWRGLWWTWLFLVVVAAGDIVIALRSWPAWGTLVVNGTMLALLLAPATRRHARRQRRLPGWGGPKPHP